MESSKIKSLTKSDIYSKLINIRPKDKDANKYLSMMVGTDSIPYEVLVYVNRFDPIPQLETYNRIYERRRKNPLYKNLVNENLPDIEKAIALSSLLTQSFIRMKELNEEERIEYSDIMNISVITDALSRYSVLGDTEYLTEIFLLVRDVFKKLFYKKED